MSQNKASFKRHSFRLGLFFNEAFLFLSALGIGLYVGSALLNMGYVPEAGTTSSVAGFLFSFLIATTIIILLLKFFKGGLFFKFLMAFLIFVGSETVFSIFFPEIIAVLLAIGLVLLRFLIPNVFMQNFAIILAVAGIGATIGTLLPFEAVLILLAVLSVYDVIAVYRTKHMVSMFRGVIENGTPLALIIPEKLSDSRTKVKHATPGTGRFLLLGTGDIAFPLVFAVSALKFGLVSALSVILGAFVGLFCIHLLLLQKKYGAIPALPPLIFFSLIFFLISIMI